MPQLDAHFEGHGPGNGERLQARLLGVELRHGRWLCNMFWPGKIQGRRQGQARPVKKILPWEGALTGVQVGPNLICISHVYKTAAGHVTNNVF